MCGHAWDLNLRMTAAPVPDQAPLALPAVEPDPTKSNPWEPPAGNGGSGSREHWSGLLAMVADLAFETDEWGRFTFIATDPAMALPGASLLGRSATALLAESPDGPRFNPFGVTAAARRRRVQVKRGDGTLVWLAFTVVPLLDTTGRVVGTRGLAALDLTDEGQHASQNPRRGELLEDMLNHVGQEVLAPRKIRAALDRLVSLLGAEGSSVVIQPSGGQAPQLAHQAGNGAEAMLQIAAAMLDSPTNGPARPAEARPILVTACQTRFGDRAGLAVWRGPGSPPWSAEDALLLSAGASVVRMLLEHELVQQEMARQARTDPLTGLLTRRAFLEELERRTDRLDREALPGTLLFADLDRFKPVNEKLGHEVGDQLLILASVLLRRIVRPSDLVARLSGDQFAVWLDGADHMTAAERAEYLCEIAPGELAETAGPEAPRLSMSIGIASRLPYAQEPLDHLMQRAHGAMAYMKLHGRGHWRVSQSEEDV
jgi:diguanylate cyclase (GGDEF)-like protein